jgi:hypothetical protein
MISRARAGLPLALTLLLSCRPAFAGDVELAPFAGFQFGGAVTSNATGGIFDLDAGFAWGGSLNLAVAPGWRVELLYSRQQTALESRGADRIGVLAERYMAGIQEEKGTEKTRFFGVFLLGATRFDPALAGVGSDFRFTGGLSLGIKQWLTSRLGLRAEARAFFIDIRTSSGLFCAGGCLFVFSGTGLWQGDVSAGVTFGF